MISKSAANRTFNRLIKFTSRKNIPFIAPVTLDTTKKTHPSYFNPAK